MPPRLDPAGRLADADERAAAVRATAVRVMVVDDNAGFRESLRALLDTEELQVVGEAQDGRTALALVDALHPDVVLMDVRMPSMDGIETTRRLKRGHPKVGVVALTGNEDVEVVRDMLVAGATGYVLKDSDGDDILKAIRQAVGGGAVLSPGVTPAVIEELTEALERERRRTRELEAAHAALLERAERRHELIARLGHELRTPVTVILGMAQILADGHVEEEDRREVVDRLLNRAAALARLIERFEMALDTNLAEYVDLGAIARELAATDGRVRVSVAAGLPAASLNPQVARTILGELVDNALRFSEPPLPVQIVVGRDGDRFAVRVTDHGPGIADEDRERVFEPLEQVEALNVRVHQGAGLGLSLARAAARALEGDLVLEAAGPEGTTFLWTMPLSRTRAQTATR
jgi:signal transduction histidine kinase